MSVALDNVPEMTLGIRLYMARRSAKLEQTDIAKAAKVSRALVSRWERDLSEPRPSHIRLISDLTGYSYAWLVGVQGGSGSLPDATARLVTAGLVAVP